MPRKEESKPDQACKEMATFSWLCSIIHTEINFHRTNYENAEKSVLILDKINIIYEMNFIYHMSLICLYVEKRYYLKNN